MPHQLRPIIRGRQTARADLSKSAVLARAYATAIADPTQPRTVGGGPIQQYQGEFVRLYSTTSKQQNVSASKHWDYPIVFEETGYLTGFIIAVNDPEMRVIFKIQGEDHTEITLHDHTMTETSLLGLGMTYGEFISKIPAGGGTSRDIRGDKHSTRPFLARAKTTFTGDETDYEKIKGTKDDIWIALHFDPELPRKYYALSIEIENTNGEGDRMIHEITVDRMVVTSQYETQIEKKQYIPRLVDASLVEEEKMKAYAGNLVDPTDADVPGPPLEPSIDFSSNPPQFKPVSINNLVEVDEDNGKRKTKRR